MITSITSRINTGVAYRKQLPIAENMQTKNHQRNAMIGIPKTPKIIPSTTPGFKRVRSDQMPSTTCYAPRLAPFFGPSTMGSELAITPSMH